MAIKCPDGGVGGSTGLMATHEEMAPTAFLSAVASMTPWSDFNQSPRNMYQCQMAKQTMGTPLDSYPYRADTKLYRIHTPQKPLARTRGYQKFEVNDYPLGANAVVAVLSNTGCVLRLRLCCA
jgi:DNA-directed RNA polymerase I subunit RPA2